MLVGIIGDTHMPWVHPMYLRFVLDTFDRWGVKRVVHIGDVVDAHALSFHDHSPSGMSAGEEIEAAKEAVRPWCAAFPKLNVCIGNHDERHYRRSRRFGVPDQALKTYSDLYSTGKWKWGPDVTIDGVYYFHGTGSAGKDAAMMSAIQRRKSIVQGHTHSYAGVKYHANQDSLIFGMNVGCGIDARAYAFEYSKPFPTKPVLGCGIVADGQSAIFVPMPCGVGQRYNRSKA